MAEVGNQRVVMVCVDASDHAEKAFDFYVKEVMRKTDCVVLAHVPEIYNLDWASPKVVGQLLKEESAKVTALEERYIAKLSALELSGKFETGKGKPGEVICDLAKKENAKLVVIGTRGLGKLKKLFLGSVSDHVTHHSPVPVFVYRDMDN
ncbi:universal stress protein Slr1101-like [Mercenaria mercenaria]|uniref:universal stress protein Slr1101-like n=1 Tax=Mercenaria mercenaria TaxID=6596 RepID=UPI001E1D5045|nr:universal stress protein Slr1101-like [Mercenaria mercenaria]